MSTEFSGSGLDATMRDFAAGQKLFNRYTLIRILGRGGMGIVWLARDDQLERDVALKFVPELIVLDPAVLNELRRETKRSLGLTHKNIVRIYDFVLDATSACISMEYIDGGTLSALRVQKENKVFEPAEIADWINELCGALDYAHNHARIVHRDLKPSNLMVNRRGDLKVADFGIARSLADSVSMLTHARGTSGTLVYMSPQQLDGERGTHLDDVYSFGATIYELLTSKPPFYSGNIDRQIHEKVPPSMTERRKDLEVEGKPIPPVWEQVIASCLAKDPAHRPQSIAEIARRLAGPSLTTRPVSGLNRRSIQKTTAITALAMLCFAAATGWYMGIYRPAQAQRSQKTHAEETVLPPTPTKYFNDYAGVTTEKTQKELNEVLAQLDQQTSDQVVVAIFRKKNSRLPLDDYTKQLANSWGVGQAAKKNGVVLFLFVDDHLTRLQVGDGLIAALPNNLSKQILETQLVPYLKRNDFDAGLTAATLSIVSKLAPPAPISNATPRAPTPSPSQNLAQGNSDGIPDGATFGITEVKTTEIPDPNAETKLTLRIGIKKRPEATVDHTKVKIQVFFYDTVDDKDIKLTDADVNYEWLTPNHDWVDANPEMLAVTYLRPKNKVLSSEAALSAATGAESGQRKYLGYIVRVYYHDQLQAARAEPSKLLKLYPAPTYADVEKQGTLEKQGTDATYKESSLVSLLAGGFVARQEDIAADVEKLAKGPTNSRDTTGFMAPTPVIDGTWKGKDKSSSWTASLTIKDGKLATMTLEVIEKLQAKSDHWNDIASPYNKSRTIVRRWTAESRSVEVTTAGIGIYWNDWELHLEPSIPTSALPKKMRSAPSKSWGFTRQGSDLISGSWTFRRKR